MTTNQLTTLQLTPLIHPWVKELLAQANRLHAAVEEYGSPVNIHSLIPFLENTNAYQKVFEELELQHKIFFARKANKCLAFPLAAAQLGEGADTASYKELQQCLEAGIPSSQLLLTAAIKNRALLTLAVTHQVTVVIDNWDEWHLLQQIVHEKQLAVQLNVRLGGFQFEGQPLPTRFGFSLEEAFAFITQVHHEEPLVQFKGLHFHLNGYSVPQRAAAIEQTLQLVDQLREQNISTASLDIGGGFLMNYLSDKTEWEAFHRELKLAITGQREPITYQNDALGLLFIEGKLYGEPTVYPYYNEQHKSDFLKSVLTTFSTAYQQPLYTVINQRKLELRIEPGRSLLDQCGITVAKIAFRKKDSAGEWLFGLEMNRTQLRSSSADFLLDPLHLPITTTEKHPPIPTAGYLVGAYCLEQELILKRKIAFATFPQVGDLMVFVNTAGYMTHFFESEAHLFALAKNLLLEGDNLGLCDDLNLHSK